tara:strand:+ start:823 stop:960 length:138 start_codon:yes stop_codon:yes gene_type:complete
MRRELLELIVASLVILSVAYVSYKRGRTEAFREFKAIVKEIDTLK